MSQTTLIEKIKNDAQQEVAEIQAESATAVAAIQSETEAEVANLQAAHEATLEKQKEQLERVTLAKAKQAGNIAVQSAKRSQIDSILDAVKAELVEQTADDYVKFFNGHLSQVVPKNVEVESVSAPTGRTEETNQLLTAAGLTGTVVTDPGIEAGLMIQAKDGVYDVTLARLLADKRPDLEALILQQVMS
jgi:vacuolar-type H+-ATPase subunit E/Vma4